MATVVGILDQDSWSARTDNIVVADPVAKSLTWIPRDLWCAVLGDRINEAFALAGIPGLLYGLRELGIRCDQGLVLRRSATERAATRISVEVPVDEPLEFLYPLAPGKPIEEGCKQIAFRPPIERLEGERIHQWIGARMSESGKSSDLDRIRRQQIFLRALLQQSFDFCSLVNDPEFVRLSDVAALKELTAVDSSWRMQTFADVRYHKIGPKSVLVEAEEAQREHLSQLAVIVVVRDAPWSALQAVLSLQAQELPVEVVVVNSGKIGIAEMFARHGVDVTVIEREQSLNPGAAKNLGINATCAPLVSFLTADHVVRPDWSRRRAFVHQAGAAALGSALDNANPHNAFAWASHFFTLPRDVPAPLRGGVSYQRRLFETYGLFREDLQVGDDSEFHNRLPPGLQPIRNSKIRALRPNPSSFFALLEDQFQRGAYAARFRHELYAESRRRIGVLYLALARAIRAWRAAKKNRAVILLSLPLISLAMAAHYLGGLYGLLRIRFDTRLSS